MMARDPKSHWRQYLAAQKQLPEVEFDMRVAIAGSMTVDPLEPYLGAPVISNKFKPCIAVAPFNQLRQICHDYKQVLGRNDLDAIALLWRVEELFPDLLDARLEH